MKPKQLFEHQLVDSIKTNSKILGLDFKNVCVGLELAGSEGGSWYLLFDSESSLKIVSLAPEKVDCVVSSQDQVFEGVLKGTVNIPWAALTGKIKVKGNTDLAIKVGKALQIYLNS